MTTAIVAGQSHRYLHIEADVLPDGKAAKIALRLGRVVGVGIKAEGLAAVVDAGRLAGRGGAANENTVVTVAAAGVVGEHPVVARAPAESRVTLAPGVTARRPADSRDGERGRTPRAN